MDQIAYDEIVSVLAMFGRPDLISEFKDNVKIDPDYVPKFMRRDSLSNSEGSAESESDYEVEMDEEGFQSLK
jgi:hypothetical protein